MSCKTCKHFHSARVELQNRADGYCRRFPPNVQTVVMPGVGPIQATSWPAVKDADECGEHQLNVKLAG